MSQVTITAFSDKHLPSKILLSTWMEAWEQHGGQWGVAAYVGDRITIEVNNIAVATLEGIVNPTIEEYNETHRGNHEITVIVT